MIPHIIHYCWLGGNPLPPQMQRYIESWKRVLPDYEIMRWDETNFDVDSIPWVREAYDAGMYAFASDYIRFYAVYTMGGIYLDTDVEVIRPFGDLLNRPYLLGMEYDDYPGSGTFGAEPNSELMKWCMEFYHNRHFCPDQHTLSLCKSPQVMHDAIAKHYQLVVSENLLFDAGVISLLPSDYLTAMSADTGIAHASKNTRTIHHFAGTWCYQTPLSRLRRRLKIFASKVLGEKIIRLIRPV